MLLIWLLFAVLLIMVFIYGLFLLGAVYNTKERGQLEQYIPALAADVSAKEFEYLKLKNNLNIELLDEKGFVVAENIEFVRTRSLGHQINTTTFR